MAINLSTFSPVQASSSPSLICSLPKMWLLSPLVCLWKSRSGPTCPPSSRICSLVLLPVCRVKSGSGPTLCILTGTLSARLAFPQAGDHLLPLHLCSLSLRAPVPCRPPPLLGFLLQPQEKQLSLCPLWLTEKPFSVHTHLHTCARPSACACSCARTHTHTPVCASSLSLSGRDSGSEWLTPLCTTRIACKLLGYRTNYFRCFPSSAHRGVGQCQLTARSTGLGLPATRRKLCSTCLCPSHACHRTALAP